MLTLVVHEPGSYEVVPRAEWDSANTGSTRSSHTRLDGGPPLHSEAIAACGLVQLSGGQGSLPARMLLEIADGVQGANADLSDRLDTDQSQVSRAGRRLRQLGLATRVRAGRLNALDVDEVRRPGGLASPSQPANHRVPRGRVSLAGSIESRRGWLAPGGGHDDHGSGGVVRERVAGRAEDSAGEAAVTGGADDDEVALLPIGGVDEAGGG